MIKIFISYSWDSVEHRDWVKGFADCLEEIEEIHVVWDGYDLDSLVDKNYFMESGVYDADLILVVTTAKYKEKANDRSGGVGIETFLATAVHWDGMLRDKKSKLVEIRREDDATPHYLKGHFYIDFRNDVDYFSKLEELLNLLRGKSVSERPKKQRSINSIHDRVYEFTRVEDLIRVNHPNRRAIVNSELGTDFSGSNKIKYELWETKSPAISYFLALHANANIQQTAQHAAAQLLNAELRPANVTVLRHRIGRSSRESISRAFEEKQLRSNVHECTYKEYIWDYCIDEALKKIDAPNPIENYTHQMLTYINGDSGDTAHAESALNYIVDVLQKPSSIAAHLVVAPGGMGKTSLCLSVAKKMHFREDLRSSVVFIQAESVKKYVAERGLGETRISTIYDIYELYAKYQGHKTIFERSTFDLAVVCGNLTVIIDGLDELSSLFQEQFDVGSFLESLKEFHDQLGSSNILLTTRNNVVSEDADLGALAIERYELLGFDTGRCRQYVGRRLQGYDSAEAMTRKVMNQIENIQIKDNEGRVIPFLADILTTVVEDDLRDGKDQDFNISDDLTPYPSNNDIVDHVVHSIFRREETRHNLEISVSEIVEFISELVIDYGKRWPLREMQDRLKILYETRAQSILSKLYLNPFFIKQGGEIELRYSFLSSYFEVLLMLRGVLKSSLEPGVIRALSRLDSDSVEARDLRRYFLVHQLEVEASLRSFIPKLRAQAISQEVSGVSKFVGGNAKGAIASLLYLYLGSQNLSIDITTSKLLSIYGLSDSTTSIRTLEGLFIKGAFPSIDFSNLIVTQSGFSGYKNFLSCRFNDTKFMYSVFHDCANFNLTKTSLDSSMIDGTCDPGDLREVFVLVKANKADERAMIQREVVVFLRSFFRGDRFIDNKKGYIRFSNKVPGLAPERFDRLISLGYFHLTKAKSVADFYEVSSDFKASVRRLITDGYPDGKMKGFISNLH